MTVTEHRETRGEAEAAKPIRRAALITNNKAGSLLGREGAADALTDLFASVGLAAVLIPADAGKLPERIAKGVATGADMLVVAGGDGTIACAAQALVDTGMALGIIPSGTMNLLAKDLGIPIGEPEAAVRLLAEGEIRAIDVAEVNGRVFLCASMLGLPAQLGRHREAQRDSGTLLGRWFRFARAAARAVRRNPARTLRLKIANRIRPLRAASVTVTANALDDASSRLFGRASLDGGELGIYIVKRLGFTELLRLAVALARGHWRAEGLVREHRVREVVVDANRVAMRVMNDGEGMLLRPPLYYRIRPRALRVIAPASVAPAAAGPA